FLFWLFFIGMATGGGLTALLKNNQPVISLAKSTITISKPAQNEEASANNNIPTNNNSTNTITSNDKKATQPLTVAGNKEGNVSTNVPGSTPKQAAEPVVTSNNKAIQPTRTQP